MIEDVFSKIEIELQKQRQKNLIDMIIMIYNDDITTYENYTEFCVFLQRQYDKMREIEPNCKELKVYIPVEPIAEFSEELFNYIKSKADENCVELKKMG